MTSEPVQLGRLTCVLFDVDGTLIDALANQRRIWAAWARRYGLDAAEVYAAALGTRPEETFAQVAPDHDPLECLAALHELEDADVQAGGYVAFDGAAQVLDGLPPGSWALVTSNYEHRVRGRFLQLGLPVPDVIVDAAAVAQGKPAPLPYLRAAALLGVEPRDCLVIEDSPAGVCSGVRAGMTVWAVNTAVPIDGAHRHFASLREAVPHVLAVAGGPHVDPAAGGREPISG